MRRLVRKERMHDYMEMTPCAVGTTPRKSGTATATRQPLTGVYLPSRQPVFGLLAS